MKEESAKLLAKGQRALRAAEALLQAGLEEFALGRAYYAMFYAAQPMLREKDLRYAKHGSVHAAFGQHFVKADLVDPMYHRWLLDAFDERLRADYDIDLSIEHPQVGLWIERAREFLETARRFLEHPVGQQS